MGERQYQQNMNLMCVPEIVVETFSVSYIEWKRWPKDININSEKKYNQFLSEIK